jgi:hypothetical protein
MSSYNLLFAPWLFEIGQKLRVAYDDIAEPVPPHLTALLKVLEIAATETSQQSAGPLILAPPAPVGLRGVGRGYEVAARRRAGG